MKKLTSMFLALVMALALAVPAFADETLKVDGSIQMPTINVVMPTTASMVLNPYQMNVKLDKNDQVGSTAQVISTPMAVKNLSNIGVKVEIKAQGTKGKGEVDFAAASAATNTTTKTAFVYGVFTVGDLGDSVTDPGVGSAADGAGVVVLDASTTAKEVGGFKATDAQAATNTLAATSDTKNPAAGGVLNFQFFGDMSDVTTWTDKDTLGATLTFKFTAVAGAVPAPSAGDASVTVTIAGTTATAAFNAGTSGLTATSYAWASDATGVATVSGTTATGTITQDGSASASQTANITVTVTLSNGATITGTAVFTAT